MAAADEPQPAEPDPSLPLVDYILRETQYLYSLALLITFIIGVAWYSVYNAKNDGDLNRPHLRGPDGKPLPVTRKVKKDDGERKIGPHFGPAAKIVFRALATIVFLCYLGSGASMFIHAFWYEDPYEWTKHGLKWAGEWSVVCLYSSKSWPCDAFVFLSRF